MGPYFWFFNIIVLINLSVPMLIPCTFYYYYSTAQPEISGDDTYKSFVTQNCFSYLRFTIFQMNFHIVLSRSVKICVEILMGFSLQFFLLIGKPLILCVYFVFVLYHIPNSAYYPKCFLSLLHLLCI